MSHPDQLRFFELVREALPGSFEGQRVLEVGSLDINGSVRVLFHDCDYVGLDVGPGPGVDVVMPGQDYSEADESFDVVLSTECLEHNPEWAATLTNMARLLRPGGLLLLTCAAPGRAEHGTSRTSPSTSPLTVELGSDYYRNLTYRDVAAVPGLLDCFSAVAHWVNWASNDLYVIAMKDSPLPAAWPELVASVTQWADERSSIDRRARWSRRLFAIGGRRAVHGYLTAVIVSAVGRDRAFTKRRAAHEPGRSRQRPSKPT